MADKLPQNYPDFLRSFAPDCRTQKIQKPAFHDLAGFCTSLHRLPEVPTRFERRRKSDIKKSAVIGYIPLKSSEIKVKFLQFANRLRNTIFIHVSETTPACQKAKIKIL
jgi:hypothetical protein